MGEDQQILRRFSTIYKQKIANAEINTLSLLFVIDFFPFVNVQLYDAQRNSVFQNAVF